jgi:hypothetical protein
VTRPHDAPATLATLEPRSDGSRVVVRWQLHAGRPFVRLEVQRGGAVVAGVSLRLSEIPGLARGFAAALERAHERTDAGDAGDAAGDA